MRFILILCAALLFFPLHTQAQGDTAEDNGFRHMVMLKLKPELDNKKYALLQEELQRLSSIPGVNDFSINHFRSLGDPRALSDYQLSIDMYFENEADYRSYQKHPVHLAVKAALKPYLAGPPAVYDRD